MSFDAVYNCNFSGATAALCRVFEPEHVLGYRPENGGIARSPLARVAFRLSEKRALSPLNLVDYWAHFAADPVPAGAVNPPASSGGQGLGVVLAGRESRRSLPVPVLAEVVRAAYEALGGPGVFLLGSAAEQPAARQLLRRLPPKMLRSVQDLSGKTDWPALADAVSGLDALITPDTGIMTVVPIIPPQPHKSVLATPAAGQEQAPLLTPHGPVPATGPEHAAAPAAPTAGQTGQKAQAAAHPLKGRVINPAAAP